ncbi:polysaccharide biosynthesis C-terminal domain-containing protein [Candidatus Woesearchaeota archaeon]|nr:polysaccharide biosynthesis C-terminal domain-containing protein [Candidatus Woesearchaeota archaeon]
MDAEGNKQFGKDLTVVYKYSFALALPLAVGLAALAPEVLRIFFGDAYVPAAPALMILAGATLFSTLLMIPSNVLMGIGAVVPNSTILIIGSVLIVLMDLALVPWFGIIGAASANATSQLVMMLSCQFVVRKKIQAKIPWWAYARTAIAGISIPIVIIILSSIGLQGVPKLILGTFLGGVVYFGFIWLFRVIRFKELMNMVRSALKRPSKHVDGST